MIVHAAFQMVNSDGEVVEEGDCPTTDEDREMDNDSEVVWAKSAWGTRGLGYTFGDKLWGSISAPGARWASFFDHSAVNLTPNDYLARFVLSYCWQRTRFRANQRHIREWRVGPYDDL